MDEVVYAATRNVLIYHGSGWDRAADIVIGSWEFCPSPDTYFKI
jgi:hypothetical protein